MAKRRKGKRIQPSVPAAIEMSSQVAPTRAPRHRWVRLVERLLDSLIDTAFEHFWLAAVGVMIAAAGFLWLYFRSGRALWLYPWLKYAAAFAGGWLTLA